MHYLYSSCHYYYYEYLNYEKQEGVRTRGLQVIRSEQANLRMRSGPYFLPCVGTVNGMQCFLIKTSALPGTSNVYRHSQGLDREGEWSPSGEWLQSQFVVW